MVEPMERGAFVNVAEIVGNPDQAVERIAAGRVQTTLLNTRQKLAADEYKGQRFEDARALGVRMSEDYKRNNDRSIYAEFNRLAAELGLDENDPATKALLKAGNAIATKIDLGHADGGDNAYHNKGHFIDVLKSAALLARINDQTAEAAGEPKLNNKHKAALLVAALIHDYGHDGKGNSPDGTRVPFRLEGQAVNTARPDLEAAGVDQATIGVIGAAVLSTDVGGPHHAAKEAREALLTGKTPEIKDPETRQALEPLLDDPQAAQVAALLRTADILPSAGLSVAHQSYQSDSLSQEVGFKLGAKGTVWFIENVVGTDNKPALGVPNGTPTFETAAGKTFNANLHDVYAAARKAMVTEDAAARKATINANAAQLREIKNQRGK